MNAPVELAESMTLVTFVVANTDPASPSSELYTVAITVLPFDEVNDIVEEDEDTETNNSTSATSASESGIKAEVKIEVPVIEVKKQKVE